MLRHDSSTSLSPQSKSRFAKLSFRAVKGLFFDLVELPSISGVMNAPKQRPETCPNTHLKSQSATHYSEVETLRACCISVYGITTMSKPTQSIRFGDGSQCLLNCFDQHLDGASLGFSQECFDL